MIFISALARSGAVASCGLLAPIRHRARRMVTRSNSGSLGVVSGSASCSAGARRTEGLNDGEVLPRFGAGGCCLAGPMQLNADEGISISVRPTIDFGIGKRASEGARRPQREESSLTWEIDGPNYYRSSARALDGASSRRSYPSSRATCPRAPVPSACDRPAFRR